MTTPTAHRVRLPKPQSRWSKLRPALSFETKALFGVAAPLLCFGILLFFSSDLIRSSGGGPRVAPDVLALTIYAALCVTAFVASWIRAPRDDSIDAALHGAMFGAVLFAAPWALVMIPLTVLVVAALSPLALLGACAPIGFVVYYRALRERWPSGRATRGRLWARLAGCIVPMLTCVALWAALSAFAESSQTVAID